jgi:hypothetical protein
MVGRTLREIRRHVEQLAADDGSYYVVCGRTGDRPVPVAGKRFEGRAVAQAALRAAEQYRAALRRYDPNLPYHDLIVCEDATTPSVTSATWAREAPGRQPLVDFCHEVAGALFETLADRNHERVERAVMDVYLSAAEDVDDRDEFCLLLLESVVAGLTRSLSSSEQVRLLRAAADRLPPVEETNDPVETALSHLSSVSLVDDFEIGSRRADGDGDDRQVTLYRYALDGDDRHLPTLPIAIDLLRHYRGSVAIPAARAVSSDEWQLVLSLDGPADRADVGLVRTTVTAP